MNYQNDFAISYAGEEEAIASQLYRTLKEKQDHYSVFLASQKLEELVGQDGEVVFTKIFTTSKLVIVILSENYKKKPWTRYEWDEIRKLVEQGRCIPIKVDEVNIVGLPSNYIYLPFKGDYEDLADVCIKKLIAFEKEVDIERPTSFETMMEKIQDSKGALDKAYQLVTDRRSRTPLSDIDMPDGHIPPSYNIIGKRNLDFSVIKRIELKIDIPENLTKEEVKYNLIHAVTIWFNKEKPDAICAFAYCSKASNFLGFDKNYNVGTCDFAPFGDWGKAEEGFAYNIPVSKFEWKFNFEESYFDKSLAISTPEQIAWEMIEEIKKIRDKK
ncbi:MAG: toll/interleukin-1 receptor domain-containing protein [Bacteroidota bacterium]